MKREAVYPPESAEPIALDNRRANAKRHKACPARDANSLGEGASEVE